MKKALVSIGTIEYISLPDDGIEALPAKIDTGADGSAIWASNIHIEDGKLVFNFFAPGSAFYREQPVVSTAYRATVVKNSFGTEESRYKIRLSVKIGDKTLKRWFSLANRSNNTYPVLLGKNFLKNVFTVDVASHHLHSGDNKLPKVLVLTGHPKEGEAFFAQVKQQNNNDIEYACYDYDKLLFTIDGVSTSVINLQDEGSDLSSYAKVYLKSRRQLEFVYAIAEYLRFKNTPLLDEECGAYLSRDKLSEAMKLTCYGFPVPPSIGAVPSVLVKRYASLSQKLGVPFVLKEISSDKGQNNFLVTNETDFQAILKKAPKQHIYLAQKFIPNDGFYRLYVFRKEIGLAVWRSTTAHADRLKAHLNKPRGSSNASNIPVDNIPSDARELALRSAARMNRQLAGVDIVQDKNTKEWYVLEVNSSPQIFSGSFESEKVVAVAQFFDKEVNA